MPEQPTYHSQVLDHLGLVAGMFDALGIGDVIDHATQQDPETRDLTVGEAVKAMVLNGLGFINQALYLVPRFFQNKPTYRLISPRVAPEQLNDDALGRALDTLYEYGVTALYRLIAATAAQRLHLSPTSMPLDPTSFHVDGRYNSAEPPAEQVVHITKGYSRDHRPDLNQVMLELIVEHQAGIPVLLKPLNGHSSDPQAFGQVIHTHIDQLQTTYGATYLVADSALYSEANLEKLAHTAIKWITRVPATVRAAQVALAQAAPSSMAPLQAGYRSHELTSSYGGVEQRWVLISAEARQPQAQRATDKQLRQQTDKEVKAFMTLCRTTCACEADARQALLAFAQD
jgi:transposase